MRSAWRAPEGGPVRLQRWHWATSKGHESSDAATASHHQGCLIWRRSNDHNINGAFRISAKSEPRSITRMLGPDRMCDDTERRAATFMGLLLAPTRPMQIATLPVRAADQHLTDVSAAAVSAIATRSRVHHPSVEEAEHKAPPEAGRADNIGVQVSVQERARAIAEGVRGLLATAHELHPVMLRLVGARRELRDLWREVAHQTTHTRAAGSPLGPVPEPCRRCLYARGTRAQAHAALAHGRPPRPPSSSHVSSFSPQPRPTSPSPNTAWSMLRSRIRHASADGLEDTKCTTAPPSDRLCLTANAARAARNRAKCMSRNLLLMRRRAQNHQTADTPSLRTRTRTIHRRPSRDILCWAESAEGQTCRTHTRETSERPIVCNRNNDFNIREDRGLLCNASRRDDRLEQTRKIRAPGRPTNNAAERMSPLQDWERNEGSTKTVAEGRKAARVLALG